MRCGCTEPSEKKEEAAVGQRKKNKIIKCKLYEVRGARCAAIETERADEMEKSSKCEVHVIDPKKKTTATVTASFLQLSYKY